MQDPPPAGTKSQSPRSGPSSDWDPSTAVLVSLGAAVFFLAVGGSTNTLVWAIFIVVWVAIGIPVYLWHKSTSAIRHLERAPSSTSFERTCDASFFFFFFFFFFNCRCARWDACPSCGVLKPDQLARLGRLRCCVGRHRCRRVHLAPAHLTALRSRPWNRYSFQASRGCRREILVASDRGYAADWVAGRPWLGVLIGLVLGAAVGVATSLAWADLPGSWASSANAASPWLVALFVAGALVARIGARPSRPV